MKHPKIEPHLFFSGRCEEALEFYEQVLGAKRVMLMRFEEAPDPPPEGMLAAGWERKVMHCAIQIGQSQIMMSDGCGPEEAAFAGFNLSISVAVEAEAERIFGALSAGGNVMMPLAKTFWSPCFGMVSDRFGVGWMISVEAAE